jgi:hypothetical protein
MRTQLVVAWAICAIASTSQAADIEYRLNITDLKEVEQAPILQPLSIKLVDRAWSTKGVEQTCRPPEPPRKFEFKVTFPFCGRPVVALGREWENVDGPHWLDNVAWPLTREMFGLGQPPSQSDGRNQWSFGAIVLQR